MQKLNFDRDVVSQFYNNSKDNFHRDILITMVKNIDTPTSTGSHKFIDLIEDVIIETL